MRNFALTHPRLRAYKPPMKPRKLAIVALVAYALIAAALTASAAGWRIRIIWIPWLPNPLPIIVPVPVVS